MPTHTLLIVLGSWVLLAILTVIYLLATRGRGEEEES